MPESSGTKLTFKSSGVVVYSIVPFSPAFSSMSLAVTLASFKVTVTVTVVLDGAYLSFPKNETLMVAVPSPRATITPVSAST